MNALAVLGASGSNGISNLKALPPLEKCPPRLFLPWRTTVVSNKLIFSSCTLDSRIRSWCKRPEPGSLHVHWGATSNRVAFQHLYQWLSLQNPSLPLPCTFPLHWSKQRRNCWQTPLVGWLTDSRKAFRGLGAYQKRGLWTFRLYRSEVEKETQIE